MKKIRLNALLVSALVALTAVAGPKKASILSLKESITDNDIVYPSSFETNTQEMMKNWYLQNYAELDANVESRSAAEVSDEEYIRRLKAIPAGVELPFNDVVKKYITRYITKERTMVSQILGMSPYYMPIFEQALEKRGMPLELRNIPIIESALDPNAVSRSGAAGLWQFMLETGKGLGLEVNTLVDERRDPYRSSEMAAEYFKQLYSIYKDWSLVIAAYNCGPSNVNKALRRAQTKDNPSPDYWAIYNYLPKETRGYVPAFIAATYVMHYYKEHNINPSLAKKPLLIDTVQVQNRVNFNQISQVLNIPIEEIRILNPQYRHDVIPAPTSGRGYTLALPSQQIYSYIMVEDSIAGYRSDLYAQREVVEPGASSSTMAATQTAPSTSTTLAAVKEEKEVKHETADVGDGTNKYHKVKRGETLEGIASDYGMSVDELMAVNNLSRRHVSRGQVLKVSGARQVSEELSTTSTTTSTYVAAPKKKAADTREMAVPERAAKKDVADNTPHRGSYSVNDEISTPKKEVKKETAKSDVASKKDDAAKKETASSKKASKKVDITEEEEAAPKKSSYSRRAKAQQEEQTTSKKSKRAKADEEQATSRKSSKKSKRDADEDKPSRKRSKKSAKKEEPKAPTTHEVGSGESLERIAHRYGMGTDQLRKANPQLKGDMIHPGDKLNLPKTSKKSKKAAAEEAPAKKSKKKRK